MCERKIKPVLNNYDKQRTYAIQIKRYKNAYSKGYFLEALFISYSMIEDRLLSCLYHSGFIANRNQIKVYKKTKNHLLEMINLDSKEKEKTRISFKYISDKVNSFRGIIKWATCKENNSNECPFLKTLKKQYLRLNSYEVLKILDELDEWCESRNEMVHALLNKNVDDLYSKIEEVAQNGMKIARLLDNQVKIIKKNEIIRKSLNLQTK